MERLCVLGVWLHFHVAFLCFYVIIERLEFQCDKMTVSVIASNKIVRRYI